MHTAGALIKSCRKRSGLTQAGLARLAGVGKTAVFDIEKGKIGVRLSTLLRVLVVLNIKLELRDPFGNGLTLTEADPSATRAEGS